MKNYRDLIDAIAAERPEFLPRMPPEAVGDGTHPFMHGTTNVALKYDGGVLVGADTRSTMGLLIRDEHKNKVHTIDKHTVAAFAGLAEMCDDLPGLFRIVFDDYRKIHRVALDFAGKANVISNVLKRNIVGAHHGLYAVPLLAGYEPEEGHARIVHYDGVGGIGEARDYFAQGSGGNFAQLSLDKIWRRNGGMEMPLEVAIRTMVESLYDSARPQAGSSPPDLRRDVLPNVRGIGAGGVFVVPREAVRDAVVEIEREYGDL